MKDVMGRELRVGDRVSFPAPDERGWSRYGTVNGVNFDPETGECVVYIHYTLEHKSDGTGVQKVST